MIMSQMLKLQCVAMENIHTHPKMVNVNSNRGEGSLAYAAVPFSTGSNQNLACPTDS